MIATYYELLRQIHEHLRPGTYLEIGVHEGHSLAFVQPGTRAIGVDPEPKVTTLQGDTAIFIATSDAFFARPDVIEMIGAPIDLAFIDGLHLHEQTLRDFANVERHSSPGGVVLIHDCLPIDAVTSSRERTTLVWSGDVWKSIVALRRHRPDLRIDTIDVAPTGLAVITGLDPDNRILLDRFDDVIANVAGLVFNDLAGCRDEMLGVVPATWPTISPLLPRTLDL